MNKPITFGSVCSGIEAAQLAFEQFNFKQLWSSEIATFPCKVLEAHYPNVLNIGDMNNLPKQILDRNLPVPDVFCGGTPCQAFSLAGWKQGLEDSRGQLTIKFIEIANAIDIIREKENKQPAIILWENVEGVLNDKTNAFGNFISGLSGSEEDIKVNKWTKSGFVKGKKRNVAWRVIDAKYFGLAQQRRRLYVLAGDVNFRPDQLLFEFSETDLPKMQKIKRASPKKQCDQSPSLFDFIDDSSNSESCLIKHIAGEKFEFFRSYTDCLYSAYGTKWNGNAAAYNGSLYVSQNDRVRRLTPLECERLMGFPDNYTLVNGNSNTNRFQAIGNSWAVPVVNWIGQQIFNYLSSTNINLTEWTDDVLATSCERDSQIYLFKDAVCQIRGNLFINTSPMPNTLKMGKITDIIQLEDIDEKLYLSPKACAGILRRKTERSLNMNAKLEQLLTNISNNI